MPPQRTRTVSVGAQKGGFLAHPGRLIITVYLLVLFPSTLILMTELASITGLNWIDALFTATSALTVTGLEVVNTGEHFSPLGHLWLIFLMQLGGLGQMTVSMMILILFGHKISIKEQAIIREELNQHPTVNVKELIKAIVLFAFIVELIGTLILCIDWIPRYGFREGLYLSIFHAISAFNNAGFSLFSDSLMRFEDNALICLTLPALFIIGGIGFTVVLDLLSYFRHRHNWRMSLHSKLVLWTSALLLLFGTVAIYFLELNNPHALGHLTTTDQWINAFFTSATTRTAGFTTVEVINLTHATMLVMMVLMLIGAGSTSTGGGIKVSTFAITLIATKTFLQGRRNFYAFKRNIPDNSVLKCLAILVVSFFVLITAAFLLMISEKARFDVVLFEAISAFGTVGLSAGLTANLTDFGKLVLCVVMVIGRLGPLTLALALIPTKPSNIRYAHEDVTAG